MKIEMPQGKEIVEFFGANERSAYEVQKVAEKAQEKKNDEAIAKMIKSVTTKTGEQIQPKNWISKLWRDKTRLKDFYVIESAIVHVSKGIEREQKEAEKYLLGKLKNSASG